MATRPTVVWIGLLLATGVSTWLLALGAVGPAVAVIGTFVIAGLKVWFVMQDFMELRAAPTGARVAGAVWILAAVGLVLGFWFATPLP